MFRERKLSISLQPNFYWSLYILGLWFSWGTPQARPAWSPSGHILTPSLSPFRGTHARSHAPPEEVVYSLNDSCSHFPNVFSLQMSLASIYTPSYYSIQQYMHMYYTAHSQILYCITLCYIIHPSPSRIFTFYCPGRLAALGSLCWIRQLKWHVHCMLQFQLEQLTKTTVSLSQRRPWNNCNLYDNIQDEILTSLKLYVSAPSAYRFFVQQCYVDSPRLVYVG